MVKRNRNTKRIALKQIIPTVIGGCCAFSMFSVGFSSWTFITIDSKETNFSSSADKAYQLFSFQRKSEQKYRISAFGFINNDTDLITSTCSYTYEFAFLLNDAISCSFFNSSGIGTFKVVLNDVSNGNNTISYFLKNSLITCKSILYKDSTSLASSDVKYTSVGVCSSSLPVTISPVASIDLKLELKFSYDESKYTTIDTLLSKNSINLNFDFVLGVEK